MPQGPDFDILDACSAKIERNVAAICKVIDNNLTRGITESDNVYPLTATKVEKAKILEAYRALGWDMWINDNCDIIFEYKLKIHQDIIHPTTWFARILRMFRNK